MKKFSKLVMCSMALALLFNSNVKAQDESITDDQLRKYALMQEVIYIMKKDISAELNLMIRTQDGMSGKRYKELAATKGDQSKLDAIDAKEFEIQFLELTDKMKTERTEALKMVNSELAKKMVGEKGKVYKRIKEALKEDADLKAKYEEIKSGLSVSSES